MRHAPAARQDAPVLLLVVHAASVWALAGLAWTVQRVVYPGFLLVGPTAAWGAVHAQHSRRITPVVGLPWAVQGGTTAWLLVDRPAGVPGGLVLLAGALAATTVAVTVLSSVREHARLGTWDEAAARRLLAGTWLRTAAWTAGGVVAAAMLLTAG